MANQAMPFMIDTLNPTTHFALESKTAMLRFDSLTIARVVSFTTPIVLEAFIILEVDGVRVP